MNEWFKKVIDKAKTWWKTSKPVQKIVAGVVLVVIIIAIAVNISRSSSSDNTRLFNAPVTDNVTRVAILDRISKERIKATVDEDGYIYVDASDDEITRITSILYAENLVPSNVDPFEEAKSRSWSDTDAEQNIKLQDAYSKLLKRQLEALSDFSSAIVNIRIPETKLFKQDEDPLSATIVVTLSNTSNVTAGSKRMQGIQKMVLTAVPGLKAENLSIVDTDGRSLNNFDDLDSNTRIDTAEKEQKLKAKLERDLRGKVLASLQDYATRDRVRNLNVSIDFDMSQETIDKTEYFPIELEKDNPDTPYSERKVKDSLALSMQIITKEWQGTAHNPEGPTGVQGQNPPNYVDMSNVIGKSVETGTTQNNLVNWETRHKIVSPQQGRRTVSVNIDGKWRLDKDNEGEYIVENGRLKRTYEAISDTEIEKWVELIEGAIGFDKGRGDRVIVTSLPYDRDAEFEAFDNDYFAAKRRTKTILLVLGAIAIVLVGFILYRIISKQIERRRRLREEELLRQQQAERERALWDAKDEANMQVTMSVEESRRAELQENAINMAKEHPEDVAMLIRTWLMEE